MQPYFILVSYYFLIVFNFQLSKEYKIDKRIFEGHFAKKFDFPFVGFLLRFAEDSANSTILPCTVTILSATTIITAAHCFCENGVLNHMDPLSYIAFFGSVGDDDPMDGEGIFLRRVVIHPTFTNSNCETYMSGNSGMFIDVALGELGIPILPNKCIWPIKLSEKKYEADTNFIHVEYRRQISDSAATLMYGVGKINGDSNGKYVCSVEKCNNDQPRNHPGTNAGAMIIQDKNNKQVVLAGIIAFADSSVASYSASHTFHSWVMSHVVIGNPLHLLYNILYDKSGKFSDIYDAASKHCEASSSSVNT